MNQSDSVSRATAPEERLKASSSTASWKRRIRSSGERCHFSGSGPRRFSEIRSKGSWRRWRGSPPVRSCGSTSACWLRLRLFNMALRCNNRCSGSGTLGIRSSGIAANQRLACSCDAPNLYRSYRSLGHCRVVADGHTNRSAAERAGAQLNRLTIAEFQHRTPRANFKLVREQVQDLAHHETADLCKTCIKALEQAAQTTPEPYPVLGIVPLLRYPLRSESANRQ